MAVLIVLLTSWLAFRAAVAPGVPALAAWSSSATRALAVMFVFTGVAHCTKMKHDLARMVPSLFPRPLLVIYVTGVLGISWRGGLVDSRIAAGGVLLDCTPGRDVSGKREGGSG